MVLCAFEDRSIKRGKCWEFTGSAKRYLGGHVWGRNVFREACLVALLVTLNFLFNQSVEIKLILFSFSQII